MWRLVHCVLAATLVCLSQAAVEYDLSLYCGQDIYVYASAVLKVHSYSVVSQPCTVSVYSQLHFQPYSDKLRLEVRTLNVPCWQGAYLTLYDGSSASGYPLANNLCSGSGSYTSGYLTANNNWLTIDIHTGNSYIFSFELLATATSYNYESGDFVCNNLYDVASSVQCDGDNNCGDWSDEQSSLCNTFTFHARVWVIAGSASFSAFVFVIVVIIVVRRRRRLQKVQTGFVSGGYNYGTIQGVAVTQGTAQGSTYMAPSPAYMPAPPPYSGAAMYPGYKAPPTDASCAAGAVNPQTPASTQATPCPLNPASTQATP